MSYTPGPLPEPFDYCYEWDGPWGTRKFSASRHNGSPPARSVAIFTAEQLSAYAAAEVARAVAAERERVRNQYETELARLRLQRDEDVAAERERLALTDDAIEQAYNEAWRSLPSDFGHTSGDWFAAGARYVAALADPQRLQGKGE